MGRTPRPVRWGAVGIATALLILLAGTASLVLGQAVADPPANLDAIIVLGAQVKADGSPSNVLRYRLETASDYLEANPQTVVVVSGGQGPNEPTTEAECMGVVKDWVRGNI